MWLWWSHLIMIGLTSTKWDIVIVQDLFKVWKCDFFFFVLNSLEISETSIYKVWVLPGICGRTNSFFIWFFNFLILDLRMTVGINFSMWEGEGLMRHLWDCQRHTCEQTKRQKPRLGSEVAQRTICSQSWKSIACRVDQINKWKPPVKSERGWRLGQEVGIWTEPMAFPLQA